MTQPRASQPTIGFIDQYCSQYQSIFPEVRSYEAFKRILMGIITPSQRKSLSRIAKIVGLEQGQSLHHFVTSSPWTYQELRTVRLKLILDWLKGEATDIIIDETGDPKKRMRIALRFPQRAFAPSRNSDRLCRSAVFR
jgi:SRSO17 transposase